MAGKFFLERTWGKAELLFASKGNKGSYLFSIFFPFKSPLPKLSYPIPSDFAH